MAQWTKFNNPHTWGGKKHHRKAQIIPSYPVEVAGEDEGIKFWETLTAADKMDIIVVDGRRYVRKVWEKNHKEECVK